MKPFNLELRSGVKQCYRDANLQIIFSVTLMAVIGASVFVPALPRMVQELNITPQAVGMLISIYAIPGIAFAPLAGMFADRFGRKKVLVPSLLLFSLAGGACTFARDFNLLLLLRFLQGMEAANLISLSWVIICDLYSENERTAAMGYNASFINIGLACFPAAGGAMAMIGWYYPFLLSFLAAPVGLLVLFSLKNPEPRNTQRLIEYLGGVIHNLKTPRAVCLFLANAFAFMLTFGSYMAYFPFLAEYSFGASSFLIGLLMSATFFVAAFAASQLGNLAKMISEANLLKISFALYSLGLLTMPLVPNLWLLFIPLVSFGIAQGINEPVITALLGRIVPTEHRAAFILVNEMFLLIGTTAGPVLMGAIFETWGVSSVFFAGAGLSIAVFIVLALIG